MKQILPIRSWYGGISESSKIGIGGSFRFAQSLDIFSEPTQITLLPKTTKVSGATVADLVKWIVSGAPHDTNKYFYGSAGKIYKETSGGSWSLLQTTSNSGGQGMDLHDDYIYYTQDTQIGRYGPLSDTPAFDDDWQTDLNNTSATDIAPIKAFKEGLAVGHGNHLGWWDGTVWNEDQLILPPGFKIRSLDVIDEYLVIGTWKGTSIGDNEEGYIFFWDGVSVTFNFFVKSDVGGFQALANSQNRLFSIIGNGNLNINYNPFQKIQQLPNLGRGKSVSIYPGAITNWQNMIHIGVGSTDSDTLYQGVYQWGSMSSKYPEVLNFAYPISTGHVNDADISIGSVKGIGNSLYIGWKDTTTYGVDKVTKSGDYYATGNVESLLFDNRQPSRDKTFITMKAVHKPLAEGESIQLGYRASEADSYTLGTANATDDTIETRLEIPANVARQTDFEGQCILGSDGSSTPTVIFFGWQFDDNKEEEAF